MQVNRVLNRGVVDEAYDALSAPWDDDGRTRRYPIVAHKLGRAEVWVHRLSEGLNLHLVVPNVLTSDRVGDDPKSVSPGVQ